MDTKTSIKKAIALLGGPVMAADRLGVERYQTVQQWAVSGSVPPKYCPAIEAGTNGRISRRVLRPDDWWLIWPEMVRKSDSKAVGASVKGD